MAREIETLFEQAGKKYGDVKIPYEGTVAQKVKAELFDGTDVVTLVWLGQRRIPGIESGRMLRVRGRVGRLESGSKAIYNPHYEIQR